MNDRLLKAASTFHTVLYRMSRGRLGRRLVNNDMAILRTIGRVTGKSHAVPLLVLIDGDDWIVQRDSERRSEGDAESYARGPSGLARRAQSGKWQPSSDESEIPPSWIVIASHGGRPRHPEWYRNLEANPLPNSKWVRGDMLWKRRPWVMRSGRSGGRGSWRPSPGMPTTRPARIARSQLFG